MKYYSQHKRILLIDHQSYWREFSRQALQSVGLYVHTLSTYNQRPLQKWLKDEKPDLIVLGCARIGDEERRLIQLLLDHRQHLLVLSASLSLRIIRALFLMGVDDIVDKTYDADYLVQLVDEVLARAVPRNSYQAVERASAE
jgi:DNA-binding NarL/FixJ family response regulator